MVSAQLNKVIQHITTTGGTTKTDKQTIEEIKR